MSAFGMGLFSKCSRKNGSRVPNGNSSTPEIILSNLAFREEQEKKHRFGFCFLFLVAGSVGLTGCFYNSGDEIFQKNLTSLFDSIEGKKKDALVNLLTPSKIGGDA
ncbi:MAG: hypothetical protein WCS90_05060 [Bacilli bacterium]